MVALRPGCSLELNAPANPRLIKSELQSARKIPMRKPRTQKRVLYPARRGWRVSLRGIKWRPWPRPECCSVTRGQLTNAQGRGLGEAPGLSGRGPRVALVSGAGVAGCSAAHGPGLRPESQPLKTAPGDEMCCDFGDLLNRTQVFPPSHFTSTPAALHIFLFCVPQGFQPLMCVCPVPVALPSVDRSFSFTLGNNLSMLHGIKTSCGSLNVYIFELCNIGLLFNFTNIYRNRIGIYFCLLNWQYLFLNETFSYCENEGRLSRIHF